MAPAALPDLLKLITCGIYVVGVAHGERRSAFTAAWAMQVSYSPALVALSINPDHASYPLLLAGRVFTLNVLRRGQLELARHFGTGSTVDKLAGISWQPGLGGAPILADALAHLECRLCENIRTGDHEVVIGEVVGGMIATADATPMTYAETGDLDGSRALYSLPT
jgi:flavin reductase (DIM6/NTAB) family NADH-FMN oxidoreductase RutF